MPKPIVIINCKTYPEATGARAVKLAQLCASFGKRHSVDMRIAVQATDIAAVAKAVRIPVYAQHVDNAVPGKTTGWLTAKAIKAAGAAGTLLNHSEHGLSKDLIIDTMRELRKERLEVLICADGAERLQELRGTKPDFFVVEPPELIASEVSVSTGRPTLIGDAVKASGKPLLVGAGVKERRDIDIALKLGAKGVLLSSHIVLAKDQRKALEKLLKYYFSIIRAALAGKRLRNAQASP